MGHPPWLLRAFLILGFVLLPVISASTKKCNLGCHKGQYPKAYQEGHTYIYRLEGKSVTSVTDSQGDATLNLKAIVELTAKPDCVLQLQLKDVHLNDAVVSLPDIQKYALQFSYHHGHIDTDVCAEPNDSQTSLNIKRAVVSLFQSAVQLESGSTVHSETDIFGNCLTEFNFQKEGDSLLVEKIKDLSKCSYRENFRQGLITSVFDTSSGIKSTPLLASEQKIEQRFKQGILNKATSTETYKYKPFSNGEAGAKTVVETTLIFKGEKGDNPLAPVSVPKSLIFDVPHPVVKSSVDEISNALKAVSKEKTDIVHEKAAGKFAEFVKILRVSNKKDILSVYHKVSAGAGYNKVSDKKILLDALFRAGSGEAAEVAVELIKNHELTNLQNYVFYASLPLIQHVNLPAVVAVTSLLNQPDLPRIAYLGIGQTIGKHCQDHPCDNIPEIKGAIHKIREKVGNGRTKSRTQENQVISALKALGNTRFLDDATLQKLANIAADKQVRNRVRVAAIEALPTICSMKWKNTVFNVLNDRDEDSEIRIKAYLSLVNCACPHVADKIKEVLDKETVNQVGSFITSHLRNLRASTDPNKAAAKNLLGHIQPRTKFPEDFRKFSFNNELSYNLEAFGIGSSAESNVIYSQNSFVPRSTSLNLTAEVFGQSFNFFELDTRVENLDRVIEHYFGPKGQFNKHSVDIKVANEAVDTAFEIQNYIHKRYEQLKRMKREVKQGELDRFAKNVRLRNTEVDENLSIDLSLKLFGVELAYLSYQDDTEKFTPKNFIDKIFDSLHKGFDLVKDFDYNFQNHLHFLDAELVYPTGLGIPLSLGVTGTSVVHMKAKGKLDMASILLSKESTPIRLALEPSASIRVTGSMMLEALDKNSGVILVSTLHTDTAADVSIKILDEYGLDVNFGIPKKTQKIISVSSEILFTSGPKGENLVSPKFNKGKEYSDCFDQLSSVLGLTVCGYIQHPYNDIESIQKKPFYPLSGPAKFGLSIKNNDVKNYHFKIYYNTKVPDARSLEILFDTPNSKTNRRISLLLEGGFQPDKYIKVDLNLPLKKASALVILKNRPEEQTFSITVRNDLIEYSLRAGLLANGNKYKPILEYKVPEHIEKLSGTKIGVKGGQNGQLYNVDGVVSINDHEDGKKYTFENVGVMAGGKKIISLDGFAVSTLNKAIVDVKLGYGDENLSLKLDGNRLGEKNYLVKLTAVPSRDPNIGFSAIWKYQRQPHEFEQKLVFIHGADPNSEINRFTLSQHAVYKLIPSDFVLSGYTKITYPAMNALLKLEGKLTDASVDGDVEIKYEKFQFGSELSGKINMVKKGDYEVELEIEFLNNKIELKSKRTVLELRKKSEFKNSLKLSPGAKYEINGIVVHDLSKNHINLQLDGILDLNSKIVTIDTAIETNSGNLNTRGIVTVDGNKYLEFVLKSHGSQNLNGNLNFNLKNYLNAVGQLSYQNGKGNGRIIIDIPKYNRKIEGHGDLTVSGSQYALNVELLSDAGKDPNKRIKLSSLSDITKTSIDTKNILEVYSSKLELNVKGELKGTLQNGELTINADTLLPNGRYIVFSNKLNSDKKENKYNIKMQSEIIDHVTKDGSSRKIIYNVDVKDFNVELLIFNNKGQVKFINFDGRDVVVDIGTKNLPIENTDKKTGEVYIKLSGSLLPKPLAFGISSDYGKNDATYKVQSSLGNDFELTANGDYVFGNKVDKSSVFKNNVEIKLPFENLQNIKYHCTYKFLLLENKMLEYSSVDDLTYNNDKNIKLDTYAKYTCDHNNNEGIGKIKLTALQFLPLTVETTFNNAISDDMGKCSASMKLYYGDKGGTLSFDSAYASDLSTIDINTKATTTMEKLQNIDLHLSHKSKPDDYRQTDATLQLDNAKYTLSTEIRKDKITPMIHFTLTSPQGVTELLSKFQKVGDNDYTGEWKVNTPVGFVNADARINLESVDNFLININFDSDKIKERKIHAEIANKPTAKTGRRIIITVTSDGKNLITGSTNYKKRQEEGKIIVEGNGSLKIGENTRSSSFKYTRQQLTHETDGEVGVAIILNANFGPSAIVGEVKLTNKEVHVFNSYCEQSKDCAHFKLQATLDSDKKSYFKQQQTVEFNLRKFNIPAEFGLQISTQYLNDKFDHTASLYMHSTKDKSQYTYQLYIHPKEAAAILTLPSRELALVITSDFPKIKQTGSYKLEISSFLDRKNRPTEKTCLSINSDVNIDKTSLSLNGEAKFTYPSQTKDMVVKGKLHSSGQNLLDANVDIDVFAKKTQKINIVAKVLNLPIQEGYNLTGFLQVLSKGQQLNVEHKTHLTISKNEIGAGSIFSYTDINQKPKSIVELFSANLNEVHLLITSPNKEIIRSDAKMEFTRNLQKLEIGIETNILDGNPYVTNFEAKDFNNFKFVQYEKNNPNNKLTANGHIVLGQLAEVHSDFYQNNKENNLFHILVHLDENKFLKPDFEFNKDNLEHVMDYTRNRILNIAKQMKEVATDIAKETVTELKDLLDHAKKAQPNIQILLDYYSNELTKFKNELHADQIIQEIQVTLNKHFGSIITTINNIIKQVSEQLNELSKQYIAIISKLTEAVKAIYPQIQESYNKIFEACMNVLDAIANLAITYLKAALNIINNHQKEIKELAVIGMELVKDIGKIIFKAVDQIKKDVNEFITLLINQAKALPIYQIVKEKYNNIVNFEIPEALTSPVEELCKIIKAMLPTKELQDFFGSVCDYTMTIIKRQKPDNTAQLNTIYTKGVNALKSLIDLLETHSLFNNFQNVFDMKTPTDFSILTKLPGISTLRVSVLNLLRNAELPTPLDIYYTYGPTLHLTNIVPPFSKTGTIIDGGHIFTFDGNHFTLPGTCNYILVQDMQDGNFSIIANLQNGVLVSVTITEPKESITLKNNGNILVNNKPADYPASTKNLQAFLTIPTINVKSAYGVHVICSRKPPMMCIVRVSGFYFSKLRGLLGDGNNEPYDDYTLPSGKIIEDPTEFGNAYKLKGDCPAATIVKTSAHAPICSEYFASSSSPLSSCFKYVNANHYQDACDQAISVGASEKITCSIAFAYYAACYERDVFGISIPPVCVNCKDGTNSIAVGDSFKVKIPKKEADIIFIVEEDMQNEKIFKDMIVPLMTELREELKQQGITDTHIGLVGFGEHMNWPQHYTTDGSTNIVGDVKNIKFEGKNPILNLQDAIKGDIETKLKYLKQRYDVEFGTFKLTDAYEQAINYPFRTGAAKAVVGVIVSPCEKSPLPISLQQLRLLLGQAIYRNLGLSYYHVWFSNDTLVYGKPQKNIVAYDYDSVYTFSDSKKKPLEGSNELRNNMILSTSDVCADFAISSGGAAFSSNNFLEAKPNQKKQFVQVAARKIISGLVNTEIEEECVCKQSHGLFAKPYCKIVNKREKEPLTRHTKGGVKG
ncbi:apolipophorins-like [Vespa mandarinia]|uniref:apolipophorins-like n=1 Tax=Vespa mandarinia TaxID=7446 RepID=UPI00161209DF|nr:apolipophorins-like [Vespa mandarinia]